MNKIVLKVKQRYNKRQLLCCETSIHLRHIQTYGFIPLQYVQRWNLKNLSRGLNPPIPGLNQAPA